MASDFPTLRTARLQLRAARREDVPRYHEILSVAEVTRYINLPDSPSEERSERFVRWMRRLYPRGRGCAWIIERHDDGGTVAGAIRIDEIHHRSRYGVIGYESHPEHWGRGLMGEALAAVVDCAFTRFALNRLEAWTLPGNVASDRVLLGNGFRYEGTLRQRARFKGRFHDLRMFGRLADDGRTSSSSPSRSGPGGATRPPFVPRRSPGAECASAIVPDTLVRHGPDVPGRRLRAPWELP